MNNLKNKLNELNPNQKRIIIGILITLILIASLLIFKMCAVNNKSPNQVVSEQGSRTIEETTTIATTTETETNLDTKISNTTTAGSTTTVANTKTDTKNNNTVANTQTVTNSTNADTTVTKPIANNNQPTPKPVTPNKPVVTQPKPVAPTPSRPTQPQPQPKPYNPPAPKPQPKPYYPPVTKPAPKPITKPVVTQPARKVLDPRFNFIGNSGKVFKTESEAMKYGNWYISTHSNYGGFMCIPRMYTDGTIADWTVDFN